MLVPPRLHGIHAGVIPPTPYAALLRIETIVSDGSVRLVMPFADDVLGRPGFLHGGAIAGLLEFAALAQLRAAVAPGVRVEPATMSLDFLRGGTGRDTHAAAVVRRLGRRVANVEATAWQEDEGKPIAAARMNLLLIRE